VLGVVISGLGRGFCILVVGAAREALVVRVEGSSVRGGCEVALLSVSSLFLLPMEEMLRPEPVLLSMPLREVEDALLNRLCCSYEACLSLLYPSVVKEPLRISVREGAFATAEPAADMKPNGTSASRALMDARRTRPESVESRLGRRGGEDSVPVCIGEKLGDRGT
jgi:hypothetical protein